MEIEPVPAVPQLPPQPERKPIMWRAIRLAITSAVCLAVAGFLLPYAWELSDVKPNIFWACGVWLVVFGCVAYAFWLWAARLHWWRWVVIFGVLGLLTFLLKDWAIEKYRSQQEKIPTLLLVNLATEDGLPNSVTNDRPNIRMHRLRLWNRNDISLHNINCRLQLPEPIISTIQTNVPPGVAIDWNPILMKFLVNGTGGRTEGGLWVGPTSSVTMLYPPPRWPIQTNRHFKGEISGLGEITGIWQLSIDRLPANNGLEIDFLTSAATNAQNYIRFAVEPLWKLVGVPQDTNELRYYLDGQFQYLEDQKLNRKNFISPIMFSEVDRRMTAHPALDNDGRWRVVIMDKW